MGGEAVLRVESLVRTYGAGTERVEALRGVDLDVAAGELVVIEGPSGAGKTTLLHLIGGLDRPSGGAVWIVGRCLSEMREGQAARFRARHVGFVFDDFCLVEDLTALENVALPVLFARGVPHEDPAELLRSVGLSDRLHHRPGELSGGQLQRVAIARALIHRPEVLLADEPTALLDGETALSLFELLRGLCRERGLAIVATTHDPRLRAVADRALEMDEGSLRQMHGGHPDG